jgi:Acyltransferase
MEHPIAGDQLRAIKMAATSEMLLTRMCMTMFAEAFKLPYGQEILARLLRQIARVAARHILEFESLAGQHDNLQAPSRYLVEVMSDSLTVRDADKIPPRGPVLITCNHPGIFDAMVIFASLLRTDVKVIARPRNLLELLPSVRRHIIFVPEDPAGGRATLRESLRHLADGGLLVTFPRGSIEPDPLLHPQAAIELVAEWSSSVNLLAKYIPGLTVIPAAVGGIFSTRARASWLARRYRTEADRDWMAATLQLMLSTYRDVQPVVVYGSPICGGNTLQQVQVATRKLYRILK